jgi:hypothetical protein
MLSKDFYGRQGYIWFVGLVEDVDDPSQLGQVRVRVVGLHSQDKNLMPTEALPWAQVILPPTGAKTHSGPIVGDWVRGYFQDGEFAQILVIDGVFPGVEGQQSRTVYNYIKQTKGDDYFPQTTQHHREVGEGTPFRSVRGILEGTLTEINNNRLSHACGIKLEVETALAWARLKASDIINWLMAQIKAFAIALGMDPTGLISFAISILKFIRRLVNWIRDILEVIEDWIQVVHDVVAICRQIVDLILSLPERLIAFLRDCLAYFMGEIASFLGGLLGQIGDAIIDVVNIGDEVINIYNDINVAIVDIGQTTITITDNIQGVKNNIEGVTEKLAITPEYLEQLVSPPDVEVNIQARIELENYIEKVANNSEYLVNTDLYYMTKYTTP